MKKHTKKTKAKRTKCQKHIKTHKQLIILVVMALALIWVLAMSSMSLTMTEQAGSRRLITFYDQGAQSSALSTVRTAASLVTVLPVSSVALSFVPRG